jgi:hypothetical protein
MMKPLNCRKAERMWPLHPITLTAANFLCGSALAENSSTGSNGSWMLKLIASYIEVTRFPVPDDDVHRDTKGYGGVVRAADFIGQMGDPDYLRKSPSLYYEFEEIGINEKLGYKRPGDLRKNYARFYWDVVSPLIQDALRYLRLTQEGKQWISTLYAHVFHIRALGKAANP